MPRILNATLEAALDSGNFQPYFLLTVREVGAAVVETATPVAFKLSGINLTLKWARTQGSVYEGFVYPHDLEFKITRGITIAGVNYTVDSSYYYGVSQVWDGIFQSVAACMLPAQKYSAAGDVTYKTLIDALCTAHSKTAVYKVVGAAWQSYKFLGTGKVLTLNRANTVLNMLKQKYIIHATDNGSDQILFMAIGTDTPAGTDHTINIGQFKEFGSDVAGYRRFLYRDEGAAVHFDGNADDPLWNLGYLESTASPPTSNHSYPFTLEPIAPHLKHLSFDSFRFVFSTNYPATGSLEQTERMQVEEEFNYQFKETAWRINLQSFDWARGTEGGAIPGTIEAAAPYTPLNTTNFDNALSTNENNVQAAFDKLDDHTHTGISTEEIQDTVGAMFTGNTETGITVTYQDSDGTIDLELIDEYIQDVVGAMVTGNSETGIAVTYDDTNGKLDFLAKPYYLPFGVYLTINPITAAASPGLPYFASADNGNTLTFVRWSQAWHVATTNNGSNYWTIEIKRVSDSGTVATFNTSAGAANTWILNSITSFSITTLAAAGLGIFLVATKTGTPGSLFVGGPALEVKAV
jgi:hypothetical protein